MKKPGAARTDRPSETTAPENQNDAEQADAEQTDAEQADAEKADAEHADAEHADAGDDDKEPPTKKPKVTKKPACKDDAAGLCLLCVCDRVLVCVCVRVCGWVGGCDSLSFCLQDLLCECAIPLTRRIATGLQSRSGQRKPSPCVPHTF